MKPPPCAHHWHCEPQNGDLSEAVCEKCGMRTAFRNSYPEKFNPEKFTLRETRERLPEWYGEERY